MKRGNFLKQKSVQKDSMFTCSITRRLFWYMILHFIISSTRTRVVAVNTWWIYTALIIFSIFTIPSLTGQFDIFVWIQSFVSDKRRYTNPRCRKGMNGIIRWYIASINNFVDPSSYSAWALGGASQYLLTGGDSK